MTDLPIGSLWRSRHNGDIRIIVDVDVATFTQYLIEYYDTRYSCMMCTVASASAWTYDWRLISK